VRPKSVTHKMGRTAVIFGFWLLGYALGFLAYIARVPIVSGIQYVLSGASADIVGGMISGLAGSVLMLACLYVWSHSTTPK
jgi:hypothetical protein